MYSKKKWKTPDDLKWIVKHIHWHKFVFISNKLVSDFELKKDNLMILSNEDNLDGFNKGEIFGCTANTTETITNSGEQSVRFYIFGVLGFFFQTVTLSYLKMGFSSLFCSSTFNQIQFAFRIYKIINFLWV